ncbi:D(3) dopamine receptor [Fasciola hepatica]|uniref:D(3) dopamine receptor n=1 Tax=Fasciola hepatica TaxID=6192 RepID=A0A4E0RY85_FASHE|nr:D(3) dopamine receptor [Fasciola hepatica]
MTQNISTVNYSTENQTELLLISKTSNPIAFSFLLLLLVPAATLFGNSLVVFSVIRERSLRNATNWFLVSLATADIILAVLVMPVATWIEMTNGRWMFGDTLCNIFVMLDVLFCTASILNLVAISLDRYLAVTHPVSYAKRNNIRRIQLSIAAVWIVSLVISLPVVCGFNVVENYDPTICQSRNAVYIVTSSIGSFYLPAVVLLVLYHRIFSLIRKRHKMLDQTARKQIHSGSGTTDWLGDPTQSFCFGLRQSPDKKQSNPKQVVNLSIPLDEPSQFDCSESSQYVVRRLSNEQLGVNKADKFTEISHLISNERSTKMSVERHMKSASSKNLNRFISLPQLVMHEENLPLNHPSKGFSVSTNTINVPLLIPPGNLSTSILHQTDRCFSVCYSPCSASNFDENHPISSDKHTVTQCSPSLMGLVCSSSHNVAHVYGSHVVVTPQMNLDHSKTETESCPCQYRIFSYEYSDTSACEESNKLESISNRKRRLVDLLSCCIRVMVSNSDSSPVFSGRRISDLLAFSSSGESNEEFDTCSLMHYGNFPSDHVQCPHCWQSYYHPAELSEWWIGDSAKVMQTKRGSNTQMQKPRMSWRDTKNSLELHPCNGTIESGARIKFRQALDKNHKILRSKLCWTKSVSRNLKRDQCFQISESETKEYSATQVPLKRLTRAPTKPAFDTTFVNFQAFWKTAVAHSSRRSKQPLSSESLQNTSVYTAKGHEREICSSVNTMKFNLKDTDGQAKSYDKFWASKQRSLSNRERKANKTLAIVLGAFLICWLPFFTVNVGIGICLLRQSTDHPACVVLDRLMSACTWLGYVNSLLNPMIYTIFNLEFRMAFKRLLGIK